MEVKIKNENRRSTMIIKKEISERGTLQEQMLLKNNINGIARLQLVFLNGEAYYRIDLKSYRSLKDIFDGKKMIYTDMCKFLKSLAEIISRLDDYLMKEEDLMLSPEYIFYDEQAMEYVFVYLPNLEENDGAEKLAEFLIEKADENDGDAVTLTSDYFNIVAEGGISPAEIIRNRKKSTEKTKSGKAKKPVRRAESRIRLPESGREIKMTDERNPDRENPVQKKNFITGIIICISLTLMAVGLYVAVLMNPYILTMIGLSEDDYMTAGVIIAVIFAAAIIGVIHFFKKKTEGGENGVNEITGIRENHSRYYEDYGMDYLDEAIERARYGNYDEAGEEDYEDDEYDEYEEYEKYEGIVSGKTRNVILGISGTVVAALATGGLAYAFAPQIAIALAGEAVAGLYGAALTNACLAMLGGGALAAGGLGMAGGTAVVTGGGMMLGIAASGTASMAGVS